MNTVVARFSVLEPLGVDWQNQLMCRRLRFDSPVEVSSLRLRRAEGDFIPSQATDLELAEDGRAQAATIWFWCDTASGEQADFELLSTDSAALTQAVLEVGAVEDEEMVLSNGIIRVRLPGSKRFTEPTPAARTPGPILGFGRVGQPWIGNSGWQTCIRCHAVATEVLSSGPLWTEAQVRYEFEHEASYSMTLRLYEGRDFLVVDERMALRIDGSILLHLYRGLEPDRFYAQTVIVSSDVDGHSKVEQIDYSRPEARLKVIQMPAIGMYYVPHLGGHVGLFNSRHEERGLVGIVGLDGELWESAIHNRMRLVSRSDPDIVMNMPAKAGRRRWALAVTDVDGAVKTRANEQSSLLKLKIRQSETCLRDVLEMSLEAPSVKKKPLLYTDDVLERARTRLARLPGFSKRLDDLKAGRSDDAVFGYLMTGERHYAEVARDAIRQGLRDKLRFLLDGGGVADSEPSTITLSRPIRAWTSILDLIGREPGLLDGPEGRDIERLLLFFAYKMMSDSMWPHRRISLHQDHPESQKPLYSYPGDALPDIPYWINCLPNFQSDWLIALASIALTYPDHPEADRWIARCIEDLDAQFEYLVFPTGAWVESMNYALYTLSYYTPFFIMLKNAGIRNFFADERFHRWLHWHTRMLTPPDPRIGGKQTQACIGNATLPDDQAAPFNWLAQHVTDRELAGRLVDVWRREGAPEFTYAEQSAVFALLDPDQQATQLPAFGSTIEPGFGAILRHGEGTDEETFLTFKAGPVFSHYENDELSFHWHARGVPLCSDYGVYEDTSAVRSAHNAVEVPGLDGIRRGFLSDSYLDESSDYLVGDLPALIRYMDDYPEALSEPFAARFSRKYSYLDHDTPLGPKVWLRRAFLFVKPHYLVLLDNVDGVTPSRFNIHCVADGVEVDTDCVRFKGRFGMNLTVFVAQPEGFSAETGRHVPRRKNVDHSQLFARIAGNGRNTYRTVLYPHRAGEAVSFRRLSDGVGVEVQGPCGTDRVWLARGRTECAGVGYEFVGEAAFVRKSDNETGLHHLRGERLVAEGLTLKGAGPVHLERDASGGLNLRTDGPARRVSISDAKGTLKVAGSSAGIQVIAEGAELVLDVGPGKQSATLEVEHVE